MIEGLQGMHMITFCVQIPYSQPKEGGPYQKRDWLWLSVNGISWLNEYQTSHKSTNFFSLQFHIIKIKVYIYQ